MDRNMEEIKKQLKKKSDVMEKVVLDMFLSCGFTGRGATDLEQRRDHIDIFVTDVLGKIWPKGSTKTIDVKGQKMTGYDRRKNGIIVERCVPQHFPHDIPCCSVEYTKYGHAGNSVCDNQPDYFMFESTEEGTEPHANDRGRIFQIGKSFYLIESCIFKEYALKIYDEHGMRLPEAVHKSKMRGYYHLLIQFNKESGIYDGNHYCHIPMDDIRNLPNIYLKIC